MDKRPKNLIKDAILALEDGALEEAQACALIAIAIILKNSNHVDAEDGDE